MTKIYKLFSVIALVSTLQSKLISQCTVPTTPTITGTGGCGSTFPLTATLTASGSGTVQTSWYSNSFGGNAIGTGSVFATPSLTSSTVFYAAQLTSTATASLSMPPQSSTFSGNIRGYYFTAPASFIITGVRVPTDASSGNSNIAIVKFQGNVPPPLFSTTTNSFDILYLTQNNTSGTGIISVNIPVYAGDVIGVLGDRAGINSYATGPSAQTLGSYTVTLNRLGMQFPLSSTIPQQLWSETSGSISRVELYTSLGCLNSLTAYTVSSQPSPTVVANNGSICNGTSFTIVPSGALTYTYSSGSAIVSPTATSAYTVTGTNSVGCIGAAVSNVTVNTAPSVSVNSGAICSGNSFTMTPSGASTYTFSSGSAVVSPTSTAAYTVTGTNTLGCVGFAISNVIVNAIPTISVNNGAICSGNSFTITPSGATTYTYSSGSAVVSPTATSAYTVTGSNGACIGTPVVSNVTVNALPPVIAVSSNTAFICVGSTATLTASGANSYFWNTTATTSVIAVTPSTTTSYTVTGTNAAGCSANAIISQSVSTCTGLYSNFSTLTSNLNVYPNPSKGIFNVQLETSTPLGLTTIEVTDVLGRVILTDKINAGNYELNLGNNVNGIYFIKATANGKIKTVKIIKE
ncbi:MAG: T9SS type A sorting domain-containing protein [Bacteroidota bacterium]